MSMSLSGRAQPLLYNPNRYTFAGPMALTTACLYCLAMLTTCLLSIAAKIWICLSTACISLQITLPKNKEYNSLIDIIMAVDPKSCTVKELYFDFYVDESTVSIPPKKFAELERALIGKNFGFKLDDCYIDANYLRGYFRYEF